MLIAELRNDHKYITCKIEKNLEFLHSAKLSKSEQSTSQQSGKFSNTILSNEIVIAGSGQSSCLIFCQFYVCKYLDWEHDNNMCSYDFYMLPYNIPVTTI
jgi:hypothetical protein